MKKPSFLERLTGSVNMDEYDEVLDGDSNKNLSEKADDEEEYEEDESEWHGQEGPDNEPPEGELPVDMYQTGDFVVIRALVAGVSPDDLDIAITRDMVTIRGKREEHAEASTDDYFHKELFWGRFTRAIVLPEEIQIDEAEAIERHGLLEIRLPKVDKNRSTVLKVKTNVKKGDKD